MAQILQPLGRSIHLHSPWRLEECRSQHCDGVHIRGAVARSKLQAVGMGMVGQLVHTARDLGEEIGTS